MSDDDLRRCIHDQLDELIRIRRDLHAHPELGYEEKRTAQVVVRELEGAGVQFVSGLAGGTGVLGYLPGHASEAIGLRADMDALPIEEKTTVPHRSTTPGVMHACGHDGHTAILLGAARVLAQLSQRAPLPRPVMFVFQPAEEVGAGGKRMVADGCLDGSKLGAPVTEIFGLHNWPAWDEGLVGSRQGPLLAAAQSFDINIAGVGAHAAFPHRGKDPVVAAAHVISALQTIASRTVDPLDSVVVSVTKVLAGSTYNVIPASATISGTLRTLNSETTSRAQGRLHEIVTSTARAHECSAEITLHEAYPVTFNAATAVRAFEQVARRALGEERVRPVESPVMGGEDFSFYCHEVDSCFFFVGSCPRGIKSTAQLHQAEFDFNDKIISTGVELFCRLALRDAAVGN